MQNCFSHRTFTQNLWKSFLKQPCQVVDATCGNGYDALFIAENYLHNPLSKLYCFDIQKTAIENTQVKLQEKLSDQQIKQVQLYQQSHHEFTFSSSIDLFIYNLGYLPGSDKTIKTSKSTTIQSIDNALKCLAQKGMICITCYPGHTEGEIEEEALLNHLKTLSPQNYTCLYHKWINKQENAPSVIVIQTNFH